MRLGRPLALTAAAVLAVGIAAPAAAEGSNATFTIDDVTSVTTTGTQTFTGAGCISAGKPGTVRLAIGTDVEHVAPAGQAMADAEGKWSIDVDMAKAIADSKGDAKTDPWGAFAQCVYYDGTSPTVQTATFNLTPAGLDAKITRGTRTITFKSVSGFDPNTKVDIVLTPSDENGKPVEGGQPEVVGSFTTDAEGNFSGAIDIAQVADGAYTLTLQESGSQGGEYLHGNKALIIKDGVFAGANLVGNDATPAPDASKSPEVKAPEQAPAKNAGTKADPKKELAKTGVGAPAIAILALGLTGVGAVALKRRRA